MSICDIYISTFAQSNPRAEVALALSKERSTVMSTVTAIAPEPRKLSFRERVQLYALSKLVVALINHRPLRAAFWMGFLQVFQEDSLKN